MVRATKAKRMTKGRLLVKKIFKTIGLLVLAALIILVILFGKFAYRMAFMHMSKGYQTVETKLTTEQKIKDLDYMYKVTCLQNPKKELLEQAYGISYDDVYKKYRKLVEESKSEYEFLSYLSCFVAEVPGLHNYMPLPDYEKYCVHMSFRSSDIYGTPDVKNHICSWNAVFKDEVAKYTDTKAIIFEYIDGEYYGKIPPKSAARRNDDYAGGKLISLNGKDPKEMCFDFIERYAPSYDAANKRYFRAGLMFNDNKGIKYTAEILMPDGKTVTAELFKDPGFDLAISEGFEIYPELFGVSPQSSSEDTNTDVMDDNYVPTTYKIGMDKARKLVYLNSIECNPTEGARLVKDLQKALDEANAETVILDLRENGGGTSSFAYKQLLPVLFSHDVEYHTHQVGMVNDCTKNLNSTFNRLLIDGGKIDWKGEYFYCGDDFTVKGQAARNYKIYVLTSQETFSTADIIAALCKEYDNAVLIGTNTGGEGISGIITNCILPESRFNFAYTCAISSDNPEDGFTGIQPDIFIGRTFEEYKTSRELEQQGKDAKTYEVRLTFDKTLNEVLKMIDGKQT